MVKTENYQLTVTDVFNSDETLVQYKKDKGKVQELVHIKVDCVEELEKVPKELKESATL